MIQYLTAQQVLFIHARLIEMTGGEHGLRDVDALASAVAREGGIGVISAAFPGISEPDISKNSDEANKRVLRDEIRKAKKLTDGILGVNIMVALTNYADMVRTSIEEGVDIIFAGAGLPLDLPGYLTKGQKTKLVPIISSARAAKILCKKWLNRYDYLPDGFVVEGPKAGGHIGLKREQISDPDFTLEKMVTEVIDIVKAFEEKTGKAILTSQADRQDSFTEKENSNTQENISL